MRRLPVVKPIVAFGIGVMRFSEHFNFVCNHKTTVKTDSKLSYNIRGVCRFVFQLFQERLKIENIEAIRAQ